MPQCSINGFRVGKPAPVRIMGVINCSPESFFQGSSVKTRIYWHLRGRWPARGPISSMLAPGVHPLRRPRSARVPGSRTNGTRIAGTGRERPCHFGGYDPAGSAPRRCLRFDIHAVNDIGGLANREFAQIAADSGLPAVLMASIALPGDPTDMPMAFNALETVVSRCSSSGIEEYILDPAIGLWGPGRTVAFDWELCRNFSKFTRFERPLLAAVSRKTFIGKLLGLENPADRLTGSIAVTMVLLRAGADMVRCHDVWETKEAVRVFEEIEGTGHAE